ncbi:hypothetical protein V4U21_000292 [Vibrio parahaemolyticus]
MLKRFYTPTQLFNHLKEERTGDADPWWDDWPSLMEQEKLAKQLIDQGTLHRSVYVGADFVDVKGLHNRSGLYGTACVVPFEKTSSYHVSSLFDLSGNEVLLEGNIEVSVDGYNATEYSVKDYVNLHGAGSVQRVNHAVAPKTDIATIDFPSFTPEKIDLREVEPLAELLNTTHTTTVENAVEKVNEMAEELDLLEQMKSASHKFKDTCDLIKMALEGQFDNIPQGTKHQLSNRKKRPLLISFITAMRTFRLRMPIV